MGVKGYAIHLSFSPGNGVLMRDNTPKSTRTQGGDPIADYIRADTRLPAYLPYPRFLLKMEISQTAKLLYSLLLDRSTLSQKNKWLDDEGRIYIIYPIAEIAELASIGIVVMVIASQFAMCLLPFFFAFIFRDIGKSMAVPMVLFFLMVFLMNGDQVQLISQILPMGQLRLMALQQSNISGGQFMFSDFLWVLALCLGTYLWFRRSDLK